MKNELVLCLSLQFKVLLQKSANRLSKGKKAGQWGMILLIIASLLYISLFYTISISSTLLDNQKYVIVYLMSSSSFSLVFILAIRLAQGHLFGFSDFDFLMSLPIKKSTIFVSKIISFLLLCYGYSAFLLIPSLVYYGVISNLGFVYYFMAFIGFLFFPLLPMSLSCLIALLIRVLSGKSRFSSMITNILTGIVFLAIMVGTTFLSSGKTMGDNIEIIIHPIVTFLPTVGLYCKAILKTDFISFLLYSIIQIVSMIAFIALFKSIFIKVNGNLQIGYHVKNYRLVKMNQSSCLVTLFKKETQKYFSNFMYVMNMTVGQVILMVGAVYLIFFPNEFTVMTNQYFDLESLFLIFCGITIILGMMSNTACVSISLEGKNLWIVKSFPIETKELFLSKILVNFLVVSLPSTLTFCLLTIAFNFPVLLLVEGIVLSIVLGVFVGEFGLIINLFLPRLEFDREIIIIKQSAASFVGIFSGLLLGLMAFPLIMNLSEMFSAYLVLFMLIALFLLLDGLCWLFLDKIGIQLFRKL